MTRSFFPHAFCGLAAAAALICATPVKAADTAADNAGNYVSWTNGSNGGTGFEAWDLTSNNNDGTTNFSGYFLGDSTAGTGDINTGGQSFGIYAHPNGAYAVATRAFSGGALTLGQTFSIQLAVNYRNGGKGINLEDGSTQIFNFNTGGDDYTYQVGSGSATSLGYAYSSTSVFTLTYLQQTATTGLVTISRPGDTAVSTTVTDSNFTSFQLYNSNTVDNGASQDNLYFNNLSVTNAVPEPSTCVFAVVGLAGVAAMRRRKR